MVNSRSRNPQVVILTADQTVNNTTTLVNSLLSIPIKQNSKYFFILTIFMKSSTVADFKFLFDTPENSGLKTNGTLTAVASATNAPETVRSLANDGLDEVSVVQGYIIPTANGNLTLQFAQNTAEVSNTTLNAGSTLIVYEST